MTITCFGAFLNHVILAKYFIYFTFNRSPCTKTEITQAPEIVQSNPTKPCSFLSCLHSSSIPPPHALCLSAIIQFTARDNRGYCTSPVQYTARMQYPVSQSHHQHQLFVIRSRVLISGRKNMNRKHSVSLFCEFILGKFCNLVSASLCISS